MLTTTINPAGKWLEAGAAASYLRMTAAAGTVAGLVAAGRTRAQEEHGRKLADHVDWSEGYMKDVGKRITDLEECTKRQRRSFFR